VWPPSPPSSPSDLAIEGHNLTAVAADACSIQPYTVGPEGLDVFSGQTVDLLLTADQVHLGCTTHSPAWYTTFTVWRPLAADQVNGHWA